jgi:hypothetical protein
MRRQSSASPKRGLAQGKLDRDFEAAGIIMIQAVTTDSRALRKQQQRPSTTISLCLYCSIYSAKSPAPRRAVSPPIPTELQTTSGDRNSEHNSTGCSLKRLPTPQTTLPHGDSYSLASVTLPRDDGTAQGPTPIPHHNSVAQRPSSPFSSVSGSLERSTAGL